MTNVLKVADVIDLGIEKEIARRDFYKRVAETFDDEELQNLFSRLRDWEETHIKKFTAVRGKLDTVQLAESYPGELNSYMDALVNEKLYEDVSAEAFAENVSDPLTAVNTGIQFEKDAILFFMELIPHVQGDDKSLIEELIAEERKHILYLIGLKRKFI
jgi:rubrerythrin